MIAQLLVEYSSTDLCLVYLKTDDSFWIAHQDTSPAPDTSPGAMQFDRFVW